MEHNGVPDDTEFILIGNSIYIRIPPSHYKHNGLEEMKNEDGPNKKTAKIMKEKNKDGQHYNSLWNPEHPTQKNGEQD